MEPSSALSQADHTPSHLNRPWGDPTSASWGPFFSQREEAMPQKATNYQFHETPPSYVYGPLQPALVRSERLLKNVPDISCLPLQSIHIAKVLFHAVIALALELPEGKETSRTDLVESITLRKLGEKLQDTFNEIESHAITSQTLSKWQASLDETFDNLCEGRYGREEIRQSRGFLKSLRLSDEEQSMSLIDTSILIIPSRQSGSQRTASHDFMTLSSVPGVSRPASSLGSPPFIDPAEGGFLPDSGNIEVFLKSSFPEDPHLREALREVMTSQWKIDNEREPAEQMLLQFAEQFGDGTWHCLFQEGSGPCGAGGRRGHTINHIRTHIDHFPFACPGDCQHSTGTGCDKRYPSPDALQKHRAPPTKCPGCGVYMHPGSMNRHQDTNCRGLNTQNAPQDKAF